MSLKAFVITLSNRTDRIESMNSFYHDSHIPINFFYGYPKEVIKSIKKDITTNVCNHICTTSMVGCASSHILLWLHISNNFNDDDIVLIIEDDTFLDMQKLLSLEDDIKSLFHANDNNLLLQLTGEGFLRKGDSIHKNLYLSSYQVHVFLGAYLISGKVANALQSYYNENKIDYHIDLSLNKAMRKLGIKPLILKNRIGMQKGMTNSNMSSKENMKNQILYNPERSEHLFYSLNFPIIKIFNVIITFTLIIFVILITIFCFIKNPFLFLIVGIVLPEIILYD